MQSKHQCKMQPKSMGKSSFKHQIQSTKDFSMKEVEEQEAQATLE
jgi:hypothetical protein